MRNLSMGEVPADIRHYFKEVRGAAIQHPT